MELMASRTVSWARTDNLLNKVLECLKMLTSKSLPQGSDLQDEMQMEQDSAAHMGSILGASDPCSVLILRALQVSFVEGKKGIDRKVGGKRRWDVSKSESVCLQGLGGAHKERREEDSARG